MATLKDIRKRISSVQNTRQITRAMKMVAAAKLRRAQEAVLSARPYAYRIYAILAGLSHRGLCHPLLVQRVEKRIRVVVIASDRGLCGSFNANILKEAWRFLGERRAQGMEITLDCVGRKAQDFFKRRWPQATGHEGLLGTVRFDRAALVADGLLESFLDSSVDAIYLVYNEFKSAIQQKAVVEKLVPVSTTVLPGVVGMLDLSEGDKYRNSIFEPSRQEVLDALVPKHFRVQLFRALLESSAAEQGARMAAMESATRNASEMMDRLTLQYNKARQAGITKELMEIVGGVEAMR